jgi:hypothetical protein
MPVKRWVMAGDRGFWGKIGKEVRTAPDRVRRGARRAVRDGVLRVDLVGLRRDRGRALADLGERTLALWTAGRPSAVETDPETLRIRSRIESIEEAIRAKRDELARLRAGSTERAAASPADLDWGAPESPGARGTNGG